MKKTNNQTSQWWIGLLGILVILLGACQSEADFSEAPIEVDLKNSVSFTVTQELAKQIALGFFSTDSSLSQEGKVNKLPKSGKCQG